MPLVGNAWVSHRDKSICILKPMTSSESPAEQHVLIFFQETGFSFVCCSGQTQFDALLACMEEAAAVMTRMGKSKKSELLATTNGGAGSHRFAAEFVAVEIVPRPGGIGSGQHDVTLHLFDFPVEPSERSSATPGVDGVRMTLTVATEDLAAYAKVFKCIRSAQYEPVVCSHIDKWFLPPTLTCADGKGGKGAGFLYQAVEHIKAECPDIAEFWVEILVRPGILEFAGSVDYSNFPDALDDVRLSQEISPADYGEKVRPFRSTETGSSEAQEFAPWLERLSKPENAGYEMEVSMFYTVGKDHAFAWMSQHPEATQDQLVEELVRDQRTLPQDLARKTAEQIAARVLHVVEMEKRR